MAEARSPCRDTRGKRAIVVPPTFWARPAIELAQTALGMTLCRRLSRGTVMRGQIVEVEAYGGANDQASHAYRGQTSANRAMFGPPGTAYIYFIYGLHHCFNIVTGPAGDASALLVRGLEPISNIVGRTDGPGRLGTALHITRELDGELLDGGMLWLEFGASPLSPDRIAVTSRIGIDRAGEAASWPWRYLVNENPFVSRLSHP